MTSLLLWYECHCDTSLVCWNELRALKRPIYVLESEDRFRLARNAALSLGLIGDKSAISVIKESLRNREAPSDLRLFSAMGLGLLNDLSGLPVLAECLRGHNESHKRRVRQILQQIDSTDGRHALASLEG